MLRILLSILLPPLGVALQVGLSKHFWINVVLTLLGYIPGLIHAIWVIVKFDHHPSSARHTGQRTDFAHGGGRSH